MSYLSVQLSAVILCATNGTENSKIPETDYGSLSMEANYPNIDWFILLRRAKAAGVEVPTLHDFRRTFVLKGLRNGMDLIQLIHLMGHTTTTVIQRNLALQEEELWIVFEAKGPILD